jgi:hypothetical protein
MKYTFLLFLFATTFSFSQPLNGNYTIGPNNADYETVIDAVTDLTTYGVSGAVVFNIQTGDYLSDIISIGNIDGTSSVNTITFQSETLNPTDVHLEASGLFSLHSGVNNLVFQYLTFDGYTSGLKHRSFDIQSNVHDITISNSIFVGGNFNISTSYYGDSDINRRNNSLIFIKKASEITIKDNLFYSTGAAVSSDAGFGDFSTNISILNNRFAGRSIVTLDLERVNGMILEGNIYEAQVMYRAIYTRYLEGMIIINRNKIVSESPDYSSDYTSAISIRGKTDGTGTLIVKNNFILSNFALGISGFQAAKVYNNSFSTNNKPCLAPITSDNTTSIEVFNNIFFNNSGPNLSFYDGFDFSMLTSDNNVFNQETNTVIITSNSNNEYYDFEEWKTFSGKETNSFLIDHVYLTDTDLHTYNSLQLDGSGIVFPEVLLDIDGESRDATNPDIGADEYDVDPNTVLDLEITSIVSPNLSDCENDTAEVAIKNNGLNPVISFDVECSLNGFRGNISSYNITINPNETVNVPLTSCEIVANTFYEKFEIYVSNPNGMNDNDYSNNKAQVLNILKLGDFKIMEEEDECDGSYDLSIPEIYGTTILWSTTETTKLIRVTEPGTYSVSVSNNLGCEIIKNITIN